MIEPSPKIPPTVSLIVLTIEPMIEPSPKIPLTVSLIVLTIEPMIEPSPKIPLTVSLIVLTIEPMIEPSPKSTSLIVPTNDPITPSPLNRLPMKSVASLIKSPRPRPPFNSASIDSGINFTKSTNPEIKPPTTDFPALNKSNGKRNKSMNEIFIKSLNASLKNAFVSPKYVFHVLNTLEIVPVNAPHISVAKFFTVETNVPI